MQHNCTECGAYLEAVEDTATWARCPNGHGRFQFTTDGVNRVHPDGTTSGPWY